MAQRLHLHVIATNLGHQPCTVHNASLVPRPPHPAFVACSTWVWVWCMTLCVQWWCMTLGVWLGGFVNWITTVARLCKVPSWRFLVRACRKDQWNSLWVFANSFTFFAAWKIGMPNYTRSYESCWLLLVWPKHAQLALYTASCTSDSGVQGGEGQDGETNEEEEEWEQVGPKNKSTC